MINIIGQLIGYASILMNVLSYQQSDYKRIMTFQVLASVCSLLHYGLIFAWTGLVLNVIGLLRSIAFRNRSEKSD
ncbi:MAG: YgjV family protein, partial [Clostridia bacterium]|nr:YgjV family protein [Clostridia bacterium]